MKFATVLTVGALMLPLVAIAQQPAQQQDPLSQASISTNTELLQAMVNFRAQAIQAQQLLGAQAAKVKEIETKLSVTEAENAKLKDENRQLKDTAALPGPKAADIPPAPAAPSVGAPHVNPEQKQ